KCAVENMAGLASRVNYDAVPGCIFSFPPVAAVGLTEEAARDRGIAYRSGKFLFAANGKAVCMGETDGFVKVLTDEEQRVIGVHIIGPHASDLILEGTLMVQRQMTIEQVAEAVHPHPTLGEALQEAALDSIGQAIHLLPRKKNTTQSP
ncbi:MAG: dihydrolipoyl dehydrogenase, partial [Syntrophomonadaceae bacterium]|nr:dihydrolipoyl dehydrogenase [Syntrophomonadaceae bacterium]